MKVRTENKNRGSKRVPRSSHPALAARDVAISEIKPYERNPRTHPPDQIALLAQMMLKYGIDQPIVVDEKMVILKGHGRRLAAIAAGFERFPVVIRRGLSAQDKIEMRVADNQVSLLAGWDKELIRLEVTEFKSLGGELKMLGFGDVQLVQFMTMPSPPGEFPKVDETIPVEHQCPKCGYKWSGKAGVE
jgi:hypothetical protein